MRTRRSGAASACPARKLCQPRGSPHLHGSAQLLPSLLALVTPCWVTSVQPTGRSAQQLWNTAVFSHGSPAKHSLAPSPWAAALRGGTWQPLRSQGVRSSSEGRAFQRLVSPPSRYAASRQTRELGFSTPAAFSSICLPWAWRGSATPAAQGLRALPACGHLPKSRHVIKLVIKVFGIGCAAPESVLLCRAMHVGQAWERSREQREQEVGLAPGRTWAELLCLLR